MEKKKFKYLDGKEYRTFELPNGKYVNVFDVLYNSKIDIDNEMYVPKCKDEEFENLALPTMNELVHDGIVKEVSCIENTYDIDLPAVSRFGEKLTAEDFDSMMDEFAQAGFNVTWEALYHNYSAWLGDLKSGYRDEKNGYHLFTPCGCNPLSFRATSLHEKCNDWQTTYE